MSCEFTSITTYLESQDSVKGKINAINALIDAMIISMAEHAIGAGSTIGEYALDDGQVKVKTVYRSITEVSNGIETLEKMKQLYINRFNGRKIILRDERSFR